MIYIKKFSRNDLFVGILFGLTTAICFYFLALSQGMNPISFCLNNLPYMAIFILLEAYSVGTIISCKIGIKATN